MKRKVKILSAISIAAVAVLAALLILASQLQTTTEGFGIYLLDSNELVISDKDIMSYNKTSHEIKLSEEGIARITALDLYQKSFTIKLGDRDIYSGSFLSRVSSKIYSGIVILDVLAVQHSLTDRMTIEAGYPSPEFFEGIDPRGNPRVLDHFRELGKLTQ